LALIITAAIYIKFAMISHDISQKFKPILVFLLLMSVSQHIIAQEAEHIPRTEYGFPDFQGYWNNASQTPIERPADLGNKRSYTIEEAMALQAAAEDSDSEKAAPLDPNRAPPADGGVIMFQADENFANTRINLTLINGEYRTSLIVEPENGRYPFVEDGANKDIFGQWRAAGHGAFDGPEIRSQMERCLHVGAQMPPMMAWTYNANYQIVQTQDYFMLLSEMAHDARIIPIDAEHQSPGFSKWFGDSVAHWEDDTLVVHTTGFHPQQSNFFMKSSDQFEVTEYFTLLSSDEIIYRYTVSDPVIYSQPFTLEMQLLKKSDGEHIYEFACHEGNYSLPSILAGARRAEADARANP
jgi:hypothetical protein